MVSIGYGPNFCGSSSGSAGVDGLSVGLHYFDLLWICCTTSCTTISKSYNKLDNVVSVAHWHSAR